MNEMYVCHLDTSVMFAGTKDECEAYEKAQSYCTNSWRISSVESYGDTCYSNGYDNGYDCGYDQGVS
jgi:hypothetical protein